MTAPRRAGDGLDVLLVATYSNALSAFIAPLARHLEARGHRVTLAASDEMLIGPATFPQLQADGFRTRIIPFTNRMRPDRDLASGWAAYRLMRRERFDIVHTFTAKAGFLGRIAGRLARVPVVVHTAFSFPHLDTPEKAWLYLPMERLATRACDHVFCISELGHRQTATVGARPRSGVSNPGIGLDLARFEQLQPREASRAALALPPAVPLVGTTARLVPHKRVDRFLESCRLIADRRPDAAFAVLGDGPERASLRALCTRLGLDQRVRFLAGFSSDDMVRYFRALDVFMLPTEREGFGMVFAEAMSQETPAIGPDMPPVDEIIGDAGVLIDPRSGDLAGAYADAALALIEDPARRRQLGVRARQRIWERFDQGRSFRRIEETYHALLERRG